MRTLAVLASLVCLTAAVAAPAAKNKDAPLYFPTTEGAKSVYEVRFGDSTSEAIETVTKVEAKDGVFRVTIAQGRGQPPAGMPRLPPCSRCRPRGCSGWAVPRASWASRSPC
jgi:hypothetical protein